MGRSSRADGPGMPMAGSSRVRARGSECIKRFRVGMAARRSAQTVTEAVVNPQMQDISDIRVKGPTTALTVDGIFRAVDSLGESGGAADPGPEGRHLDRPGREPGFTGRVEIEEGSCRGSGGRRVGETFGRASGRGHETRAQQGRRMKSRETVGRAEPRSREVRGRPLRKATRHPGYARVTRCRPDGPGQQEWSHAVPRHPGWRPGLSRCRPSGPENKTG